jgi:antitoxin YefM
MNAPDGRTVTLGGQSVGSWFGEGTLLREQPRRAVWWRCTTAAWRCCPSRPSTGIDHSYDLPYACGIRSLAMTSLTASEARANLYRLIDQTAESHQPILIAGKRSSAVLLSAEDWQAIQETLYLLSVPGMRESIKKGMAEPLAKSAKDLRW